MASDRNSSLGKLTTPLTTNARQPLEPALVTLI